MNTNARIALLIIIMVSGLTFGDNPNAKFPIGVLMGIFLATADWGDARKRYGALLRHFAAKT